MNIRDEIKVAWAEYIVSGGNTPTQIILPSAKFKALLDYMDTVEDVGMGKRKVSFDGLRVYKYSGEQIVFAGE